MGKLDFRRRGDGDARGAARHSERLRPGPQRRTRSSSARRRRGRLHRRSAGATVAGNIAVFTSPTTDATQVRFWLDNPTATGTPRLTENFAPVRLRHHGRERQRDALQHHPDARRQPLDHGARDHQHRRPDDHRHLHRRQPNTAPTGPQSHPRQHSASAASKAQPPRRPRPSRSRPRTTPPPRSRPPPTQPGSPSNPRAAPPPSPTPSKPTPPASQPAPTPAP